MSNAIHTPAQITDAIRIANERQSQRLATAFVASGLFFMLLPGTFLGVWNLLDISQTHLASALPQAWLQAHGQAQIFGWIGSFILGIGFYSLTKIQSTMTFPTQAGWAAWILWTLGTAMRWLSGILGWQWRILLPLSGLVELAAFLFFYFSVRRHRMQRADQPKVWIRLIALSTLAFMLTLVMNFGILLRQALIGESQALPHLLDQQFVILAVWGILIPTIWGFNARWLPVFLGLKEPDGHRLLIAYGFSVIGVAATLAGFWPVASILFLFAALLSIDALRVWERAVHPAKLLHVHPSFAMFARLTYGWLLVSCILALFAVAFDRAGGIWGASRHALTVGFVASMVFVVAQRILPAFCGMRLLWSKGVMFWSLLLLFVGCFLRVSAEPLAYENLWTPAWKVLPISGLIELAAVSLFALNMVATLLRPPAHLSRQTNPLLQARGLP